MNNSRIFTTQKFELVFIILAPVETSIYINQYKS